MMIIIVVIIINPHYQYPRGLAVSVKSLSMTGHFYSLFRQKLSDCTACVRGHAVAQLVEALHYKPEGRGFDSRWCHNNNPFGRTMVLGSTQPLTEMSTRNISWG